MPVDGGTLGQAVAHRHAQGLSLLEPYLGSRHPVAVSPGRDPPVAEIEPERGRGQRVLSHPSRPRATGPSLAGLRREIPCPTATSLRCFSCSRPFLRLYSSFHDCASSLRAKTGTTSPPRRHSTRFLRRYRPRGLSSGCPDRGGSHPRSPLRPGRVYPELRTQGWIEVHERVVGRASDVPGAPANSCRTDPFSSAPASSGRRPRCGTLAPLHHRAPRRRRPADHSARPRPPRPRRGAHRPPTASSSRRRCS